MTRAQLQLLVALIVGLLVLAAPLVLLVRAMRRDERRTRLTNSPVTGLVLLGAVSIGAWLWISLTDVEISANIQGPSETFLLAVAAIGVYLLWLALPVAAATWLVFKLKDPSLQGFIAFVFVVVLASVTGLLMLIAAWGLEPRRRWREWRVPSH